MKKTLLYATFCASLLFFSGCDFLTIPTIKNSKIKTLKNVNGFFLVNPELTCKQGKETWSKARTADSGEILYENGTRTFYFPDLPKPTNARAATGNPVTANPTEYHLGDQHSFKYDSKDCNLTNGVYYATMRYEGEHCYIWQSATKEPEKFLLTGEKLADFAAKFDAIYEKETALCGPKFDGATFSAFDTPVIPANKKISIILCNFAEQSFLGCFVPDCFFRDPYGNNSIEGIFLNSSYTTDPEKLAYLFSAASHEFNHMLNFVNKYLKYGINIMYEENYNYMKNRWYTEMLSMVTEDFFTTDLGISYESGPQGRLYNFLKYRTYTYGFKKWHYNDDLTYASYANAYAFGAFLMRNYGGAELFHEIATNEYAFEESVVNAVNKINGTNKTFTDLLCEFPYVMVNESNQNSEYPSLCKTTKKQLPGVQNYYYELDEIGPSKFPDDLSINAINIEYLNTEPLDAYGFQFVKFNKKTTEQIEYKNFLICETF